MTVGSLTPGELAERMRGDEPPCVLDVREPEELALCGIEGAVHIPLGELSVRHVELDPDTPLVCVCHHGIRSASAAVALETLGFERVDNLTGGIDRWAREVDPAMPRY